MSVPAVQDPTATPEGAPSDSDSGLRAVAACFVDGESLITRRVLDAIALSEQAVLQLGDTVGGIVLHAREQVEESARLAIRCEAVATVSQSIAEQAGGTLSFVEKIAEWLHSQRQDTKALSEEVDRIIEKAVQASKGGELAEAPELLGELLSTSKAYSRGVLTRTSMLLDETEQFHAAMRTALVHIRAAQVELPNDVSSVIQDSEIRCERI